MEEVVKMVSEMGGNMEMENGEVRKMEMEKLLETVIKTKKVKKVIAEVRWADSCTSMSIITDPSVQYCEKCYAIIFGFEPYKRCPDCGNQL